MQRIAIIGCGGSGKSTLARELGRRLGLPVHHLDRLYWQPGWVETASEPWRAQQTALCAQPVWIIDGNYSATLDVRLAAADTIIFFDLATRVCLRGALQRFWQHRGRTRPDMGAGCPEQLTLQYLWWICTYRLRRRPGILRKLASLGTQQRVLMLQSRRAVTEFVDGLPAA